VGAQTFRGYVAAGVRLGRRPPRRLTGPDAAVAVAAGACSAGGGLGSAAVRRRPSPISRAMAERRAE
jgi:hypothetical protein